jgi:hypothetical protein
MKPSGRPSRIACPKNCLPRCAGIGVLVINPVSYAEVGAVIETIEALNQLLPKSLSRRAPLPWEAAFLAGHVFCSYHRRGVSRSRVRADFFIGAQVATEGMRLITRDQGYTRYFQMAIKNPAEYPNPDNS